MISGRLAGSTAISVRLGAGPPPPPLAPPATRIIAALSAVGADALLILRPVADMVTLVSDNVSVLTNEGTLGSSFSAVQGNPTFQPPWNATGINGRPCLDLSSGSTGLRVATPSVDLSSYGFVALFAIFQDPSAIAAETPFGSGAGGVIAGSMAIFTGWTALGSIGTRGGNQWVYSAATYPMTTPAVVTATLDGSTNKRRIRHASTDVTASFSEAGSSYTFGNLVFTAGNGGSSGVNFTGLLGPMVLAASSTAIDGSVLTEVETIMAEDWGL